MSFSFSQPAPGIVPIDSISFAELAKVDASSVLGNPSGSLADASSITFTNLTSLLDPFAGTLQGLVPASSNTGTLFLRDDGTWVAAGGVTDVTATAPLASSGGLTPDISISQADSTTDGYLSSTDWNTFDSKQPAGDYITDLTGEVTASGPGSVSATIAGQSGNGTKVLATNGTTVSWQYAGLGDGSFGANNVILGSGLGSLQNTRTNVIVSSTTNPYTTANNNVCIGSVPGPVNREYSTLVGINVQTYTGLAHTAFGYNAKCGEYGTSVGYGADAGGMFYSGCTAIGYGATCNNGNDAVAVGFQTRATRDNTVAVGRNAKTDGANSTVVGAGSGNNATGANNTILGQGSATALTTGSGNVILGQAAGTTTTSANNCFLVNANGRTATDNNEININNFLRIYPSYYSAIGIGHTNVLNPYVVSIGSNTGGGASNRSINIGNNAGGNAGTSSINIGDGASQLASTGGSASISIGAGGTTFFGNSIYSIAIGYQSAWGTDPTGPGYNVAIGYKANYNLSSGGNNIALGTNALYTSAAKSNCIGIGSFSGYNSNTSNEFYLDSRSSALASNALEKTNSLMYGQFNATPSSQTLTINAEVTATYGVAISTLGKGLAIKTGANAKIGTVTMPGTNPNIVSVSTSAVTANSMIFITAQTPDGGLATPLYIESKTVGSGFEIKTTDNSYNGDVGWMIVEATP